MGEQIFVKMPDLVFQECPKGDSSYKCSGCYFKNHSPTVCQFFACEPKEREDGKRGFFKRKETSNG